MQCLYGIIRQCSGSHTGVHACLKEHLIGNPVADASCEGLVKQQRLHLVENRRPQHTLYDNEPQTRLPHSLAWTQVRQTGQAEACLVKGRILTWRWVARSTGHLWGGGNCQTVLVDRARGGLFVPFAPSNRIRPRRLALMNASFVPLANTISHLVKRGGHCCVPDTS